ncbi:hypothetical protein ERX46_14900 [Brumimicrobium glaciale]|uniref:Sulfatase N-terminal domain-containing protein n=1 Tax=Brumimicrobium glaciale TaxID=200475 RepID=A0A4Q4KIS6_9FLAO|nr:LTA synthase family protein [Brumimicrobium glaciale]RYM32557.1 hypothetical protein ERX46_14900 [Brumimicrobium glaciale]
MIKQITKYSIALFLSLIITWSIGLIVITNKHYMEGPWITWIYGIINAVLATGLFTLILFPLYYLGRKFKITRILIHILFSTVLLLELISLFYFTMTLELLGSTIFQFSWDQASIILENYFIFKWYYLLLPFPVLLYFLFIRFINFKKDRLVFYLLLAAGIPSLLMGLQIERENGSFSEVSKNKAIFFVHSVLFNQKAERNSVFSEDVAFYQKTTNPKLQSQDYPLYHSTDQENTLKPFFDLKETPPNIVFLVVESLSSSFSGPEADEISYTPFLDSLSEFSLYFDNSLATSERSFAVLPSMLGSLPHGKAGFTNNKAGYPNNETLATWLFSNGYQGDFHFGGYARFDYMDLFMNNQGFKNIYDRKEYNYEGTGLQTSIDSIPFGIPDKQFLQSVIEKTKERKSNAPFMDVYLTLSMHYPYMIEDHNAYYEKVRKVIAASEAGENTKKKHLKYVAEFATFLYTDDALNAYFHEQKKLKAHENTIYIILGDHMMGEIPQGSHIEKYRSVLMIYSPLLKKATHFKGVNSHLDIAPSFYNLLQEKYKYPELDSVSWLGKAFDTSSVFQSNRDILFMLNDRRTENILHNNHYYSKGKLYKLGDRLSITEIKNDENEKLLANLLAASTIVHDEVVSNNILIPYKSDLEVLETINKKLEIDDKVEYSSIYSTILVKPYKEIIFDINLKLVKGWTQDEEDENHPILVCSIKRGEESIFWDKLDLKLADMPIEKDRQLNYLVKSNMDFDLLPGDKVSLYFWNKNMSKTKYEALLLPIIVKAKEK